MATPSSYSVPLVLVAALLASCAAKKLEPITTGVPEVATPDRVRKPGDCALEVAVGAAPWQPRGDVACGSDGKFRFLVVGDVGDANKKLSGTILGAENVCRALGCDMGLMPGDLIYGDGGKSQLVWDAVWLRGFAQLGLRFAAVRGNHEYRENPRPAIKRKVLKEADDKAGLVIPGPSFAVRVLDPQGEPLIAIAALDTDSIANPGGGMPGLGKDSLRKACAVEKPVVWLGHHPISSQGFHRFHEARLQKKLRTQATAAVTDGCPLAVVVAGHDHDLQTYGPGCESVGAPGQVLSGASQGTRGRFSKHLETCPGDPEAASLYRSDFGDGRTGFSWVAVDTTTGEVTVRMYATDEAGNVELVGKAGW